MFVSKDDEILDRDSRILTFQFRWLWIWVTIVVRRKRSVYLKCWQCRFFMFAQSQQSLFRHSGGFVSHVCSLLSRNTGVLCCRYTQSHSNCSPVKKTKRYIKLCLFREKHSPHRFTDGSELFECWADKVLRNEHRWADTSQEQRPDSHKIEFIPVFSFTVWRETDYSVLSSERAGPRTNWSKGWFTGWSTD